ncbi:MAG: imidazole glycerol phosphate synthase subunit HisH [Acidimicrobiia bacterium]
MTRVVVVDHGAGNLVSIAQGLSASGAVVEVSSDPRAVAGAEGVVLPGVGATATVMEGIRSNDLSRALEEVRVPMLGICVGMQVFFETSEEDGAIGLGLIPGVVRKLDGSPRLPHIGWNDVSGSHPLLAGTDGVFYFVHSFAPVPDDPDVIIGLTEYDDVFVSAVATRNLLGVQFHPERSGEAGLRLLANFVSLCAEVAHVA